MPTTPTDPVTPDDPGRDDHDPVRRAPVRRGVSLVLDCRDDALPAVVHWGAALGPLDADALVALADADVAPVAPNEADEPVRLALLPEPHRGWTGRPGLAGHRDGRDWSPAFTVTESR